MFEARHKMLRPHKLQDASAKTAFQDYPLKIEIFTLKLLYSQLKTDVYFFLFFFA